MKAPYLILITLSLWLFQTQKSQAQSQHNQFWNEYALNRSFNKHWAAQLDIGLTFTSVPDHHTVFGSLAQVYGRSWIHYLPNNKWKLSAFYAYFYNHYVPEIDQRKAPEWRSAIQAIYYIHKGRYLLNTRFRIEDRHIYNTDSVYEAVNRFRAQIKLVCPINAREIQKGVFYGLASDELFFKTKSKISGPENFDRNRFTIGIGYALTDNFILEVSYANEQLPRKSNSEYYDALQVNVSINNLFPRIKRLLKAL